MSGVYGEPVDVALADGRPARFVWRGRLYTVLAVTDRWEVERFGYEFWRVKAAPGKNVPASAFELRRDAAGDRWLLSRIPG